MKKTLYSFMAFAAVAMTVASCSSDIEKNTPAGGKEAKTFSATQETSGATSRTALDTTDPTKVNWQNTDAITVWDGTAKNQFTVAPKSDATTADISGSVTSGSTSFIAVYPNSVGKNCTYTDVSITGLVIPATQTATAGTFDPAAAIMVAQTTNETLAFKHVCSFLKITTAAAYTKIVVSTTSANIAGTFSVVPSTGAATATPGANEITLSGPIAASTDYYIAIAPCANVAGLNVKCYTSETEYVERAAASGKTPTFARGGVYNMGVTTEANGWKAPGDPNLLSGDFSVSATKKVKFTRSNIYYNTSENAYHFEENATDYPTTWNTNHVSHFIYSKTESETYAQSYCYESATTDDKYWCNESNKITVDGISDLFVLSKDEWSYLIGSSTHGRNENLRKFDQTVNGITNCLLIAPDNFDTSKWHSSNSYTLDEISSLGLVCLPAAGNRYDSSVSSDDYGGYWSSTPDSDNDSCAYCLEFNLEYIYVYSFERGHCRCVRLVRLAQ